MKKILVTTDFSDNSKAGLLFAIQMAEQSALSLTFFNACHILTPTAWNFAKIDAHENEQIIITQKKLELFVQQIYNHLHITATTYKCIVVQSVMPQSAISDFAENNKFDFICISTRGAGVVDRLLGTNTGNLINHSAIPVIAVPFKYNYTPIVSILYAADFINFKKEIPKVVAFAKPLLASIELLHLTTILENADHLNSIKEAVKKVAAYNINFNLTARSPNDSLISDIETAIKKIKPSMIILFTNQNRGWFEKIFISSKSAEYSFKAKVPLLVFNKS